MDVIDLLTQAHRELERLLDALDEAEGRGRRDLREVLAHELALHSALERTGLYPHAGDAVPEEALGGHEELEQAAIALAQGREDAPAAEALRGLVGRHVETLESDVFPRLRRTFGRSLGTWGERLRALKDQLSEAGPLELLLGREERAGGRSAALGGAALETGGLSGAV